MNLKEGESFPNIENDKDLDKFTEVGKRRRTYDLIDGAEASINIINLKTMTHNTE